MDFTNFDANNIPPPNSFEPLPAGWYKVAIVSAEEKPNKAMTGAYIQFGLEVIEGEYGGRRLFDILNVENPNKTAEDIAKRQLGAICRSINVMTPRDLSDFVDKVLMAKVAIQPPANGYEASNKVKEYAAPEQAAKAAPAAATNTTPPWKR